MGLLYTQELADRAHAWIGRPLTAGPEGKRSADGLLELASIWAAIHRQPLPECIRQCQYSERQASVAAYLREFSRFSTFNSNTMSDTAPTSQYQIAPEFAGQSFVHDDFNGAVTAENLTDEAAEFFISKGRDDAFVKIGSKEAKAANAEQVAKDTAPDDLATEQAAHKATTAALEAANHRGDAATTKLAKEQEAHTKATEALKAEKEAHKATKAENSELQKQVKDLQKQLDAVAKAAEGEAK